MWSTLSKFFGLVKEEEGTSTDKGAAGAEENPAVCPPQREWKEFDGLVTSLHSSYGLIDNEVYFTHDVVTDGVLPKVGDTVHVKASRRHQVAGWKAECVSRVETSRSWDNDWEEDVEEDAVEEEEGGSEAATEESKEKLEKARRLQEKRAIEKAALAELLADKMDVSITKSLDFGQMEIGKIKSLKIEIKNDGTTGQTLCGWLFKSPSVSSQFELSPIRLLSIDLKESSRKAQEMLPMTLDPGKTAMVTVYCNAQFLGLDQQTVVFEFEGFAIGRRIEVTVLDLTQLDLQPVVPYQRSQAAGRYQQTKEAWIVPGQRPNWRQSGAKIPKRLAQHPVPEYVRKCILEQRDVTTVLPVLVKPLLPENYAARFSALLFLEEIQQEIDIREFDLDSVCLRVVGEFLSLGIPGLAEGRPSLLVGDRAILSEPEESVLAPSYEGIIHEVLKDEVLLKFCEDFHNSYTGKDYNVRFVFSRTIFRRCHFAAEYASRQKNNILFPKSLDVKSSQLHPAGGGPQSAMATVVKVGPVTGMKRCPARPRAKEIYASHIFFNNLLNSRQRSAVFRVLQGQGRPTPYIIFGPPGTGKTVTVVECILQIFCHLQHSCILACTPSNSAADLLAERLHQSGLVHVSDMVRVNAFQRGQENVVESVKPYCADVDDLDRIKTKRVVVCTCSTAGMFYGMDLPIGHFSHVFVDEAGQATEPECMIPIGLVAGCDGQIVLAGDHLQLGPVLRSNLAKDYGLQISYLQRLSELPLYTRDVSKFVSHGSYDPLLVTKLVENYRSHPALLNLSSEIFYDGELVIAADKNLVECLCSWEHLPNKDSFPVLFHGIRGEDLREGNSPSWFNPQEAIQVMKYLQSVVHNEMYRLTYDDVGIITPYRKQVEKIRLLIDRLGMEKVKVGSVEEFQGQERLVMIISTVRSTESLVSVDLRYTLGFLSNPKRFNVSITRAHALLIIVGNPLVLSQDLYWRKLLQYCVANNAYIGCDLPEIGRLKSRSKSRRLSDETDSSTEDGEASKQHEGEESEMRTLNKEADSFSSMSGNVSESKIGMSSHMSRSAASVPGNTSPSSLKKVCSEESADAGLVPSTGRIYSTEATALDKELRTGLKEDPSSYSDSVSPGPTSNRFKDCDSDSAVLTSSKDYISLTDKMDVAGDQSAIKCDETVLKHATDDGVLHSDISTVEETASRTCAELLQVPGTVECDVNPACNETVRNNIAEGIQRKGNAEDSVLAAESESAFGPEITKCTQQFTCQDVLEKEGDISQAVDNIQGKEERLVEDLKPIAVCTSASATYSIASMKLNLSINEDLCDKSLYADQKSPERASPSAQPAKSFTDKIAVHASGTFQDFTVAGKELQLSLTDLTENDSENIERPCLSDCDGLKPSFVSSLGGPCKDSSVAEFCEHLDDVFRRDEPNRDSLILFYPVVFDRNVESVTSDVSLDVCAPDSISSVHTLCDDDMFDYEKFTGMRMSDPLEPPCVYFDKSLSDVVNHAEDDPAVGYSYCGGHLSTVGVTPHPGAETSESDVVHGRRVLPKSLDDFVAEEDMQILDPDSVLCDVEMADMTQSSHSGSGEIAQCPQLYPEGVFRELHGDGDGTRVETSRIEFGGSERACQPDCDELLFDCLRKSPTGNDGELTTKDVTMNIGDHLKETRKIGTGDTFEADNVHQKLLEDSKGNGDIVGVPVKGSMSEPSLGVSVPHAPDSRLPAKSASQTTTNEMRTEKNMPYSPMAARGFSSQRRRGGFDREAAWHSSKPFVRRGQGRGVNSPRRHFQADDVPLSDRNTAEDSCNSPDRPYGKFRTGLPSPDGTDNDIAGMVRGNRGNEEMDKRDTLSEKSSDFKRSPRRPDHRRMEEAGARRSFHDMRRSSGLESDEPESQLEVKKKIIHQMEYYFGDFNLMRDGFLQEQIARDIDGWVDLSVIVTFNRMKSLTTNFKVICDALRKSTSGVVEINDDDTKVRRSVQMPLNMNMESWLKDLKTRAAVIKNYPSSETIDNMQSFFETYGGVAHIERGISKRSYHRGPGSGRPSFELVDLVIFLSEEGLKNLAKRRFTTLKRMGLSASFTDEFTDQCVDYFYKRRVQGIPKQSLHPVGYSGSLGDGGGIQRESVDGAKFQQNRNRPYQSSSLQSQKFRSHATSGSSLNDDHGLRTSVSDGRVAAKPTDGADEEGAPEMRQSVPEMTIRPLMEIDSESLQRHSIGHRTTYRRSSNHQFSDRSYSDGSNIYQETVVDHRTLLESRPTTDPYSPRVDLERSGGKWDIDKMLFNADNMSFSRRKPCSPGNESSVCSTLDSSNQVNTTGSISGSSPRFKQVGVCILSTEVPSPQKLESCVQDVPCKLPTSRQSRRVKCFDPEFSFESVPSSSAVYDKHASQNGRQMASTADGDAVPCPKAFVSSSPSQNIPEMNLISFTIGSDWSSAGQQQGHPQRPDINQHSPMNRNLDPLENSCSPMNRNLESEVSEDSLSYSLLSDQRDDDIIIESCCEEDLEDETSDGETKSGWE